MKPRLCDPLTKKTQPGVRSTHLLIQKHNEWVDQIQKELRLHVGRDILSLVCCYHPSLQLLPPLTIKNEKDIHSCIHAYLYNSKDFLKRFVEIHYPFGLNLCVSDWNP